MERWPRMESGLPDNEALRKRGVRGESYYHAPGVRPGTVLPATTAYYSVTRGISEQPVTSLFDGSDFTPLGQDD